jgi:hypothetical protein
MGDHYLNELGFELLLASCVGFGFIFLTQFFIFKSGFKLSSIRKLQNAPTDHEKKGNELSVFGRVWKCSIWGSLLLFVIGGVMMLLPF